MDRQRFGELAGPALERIERRLGELEHPLLDVVLAGDVLTLAFEDGANYVINAHSAAGQIWLAAERSAWHFDFHETTADWRCARTGEVLEPLVVRLVDDKLARLTAQAARDPG